MNASTPTSGRTPLQFAAPPTTTSTVGVGGSFDADAPNARGSVTLESLHRASRYNTRVTRSRYASVAARDNCPARTIHTRFETRGNPNAAAVASTMVAPATVPNRSRKRRSSETSSASPSTKCSPRKRARAKATNLKKPPPQSKLEESPSNDSQEHVEKVNCCICMCDVEPNDLAGINGCEHQFCFGCIEKWAERENTCPLCKVRFTKIDRKHKKKKKGQKNTKKVKQRDQRSDLVSGTALEGLLANFASTHSAPSNLTRLFLPGFGSFDFNAPLGHTRSFRSITIARGGGDSSDEDDSPLSSLFRVYTSSMPPLMPMMQQMSFASRLNTTRSYASNSHDRTAGRGAENPLTIDDSDSDDDDIVVLSSRGPL